MLEQFFSDGPADLGLALSGLGLALAGLGPGSDRQVQQPQQYFLRAGGSACRRQILRAGDRRCVVDTAGSVAG